MREVHYPFSSEKVLNIPPVKGVFVKLTSANLCVSAEDPPYAVGHAAPVDSIMDILTVRGSREGQQNKRPVPADSSNSWDILHWRAVRAKPSYVRRWSSGSSAVNPSATCVGKLNTVRRLH